jgi:hypothetical protein|nr:MAG TPA: hypothetical protein [Herelleviridae sp.]
MFKQLLETLQNLDAEQGEVLAKSVQPAQDDKKIQAAAAASGANNGDGNGAGPGEGEGEGEDDADKKKKEGEGEGEGESTLTKSLTGANGEELIDATEMLETLQKSINDNNEMLGTALPTMITMMKRMGETIATQGEMIKSLQAGQGAAPAGRKSQVVLLAKSAAGTQAVEEEQTQLTADDLMIKSNAAYSAGKISGVELGMIDLALRSRQLPDADLLARVTGAKL